MMVGYAGDDLEKQGKASTDLTEKNRIANRIEGFRNNGSFERRAPSDWESVEAYYMSTPPKIADATSGLAVIPH